MVTVPIRPKKVTTVKPHNRIGLAPQPVAVEVVHHVVRFFAHFGEQAVGAEQVDPAGEDFVRRSLGGNFAEPVAMGEAQKVLVGQADLALERLDRFGRIVAEQAHRGHEAVAERHQRRAVEMGDQGQQEILVVEFRQDPAFGIDEARIRRIADHQEKRGRCKSSG